MRRLSELIVLALLLAGCAASPMVLKLMPPTELLQDCLAVEYTVRTNSDLAQGLLAERMALALCNNDKKELRAWAVP